MIVNSPVQCILVANVHEVENKPCSYRNATFWNLFCVYVIEHPLGWLHTLYWVDLQLYILWKSTPEEGCLLLFFNCAPASLNPGYATAYHFSIQHASGHYPQRWLSPEVIISRGQSSTRFHSFFTEHWKQSSYSAGTYRAQHQEFYQWGGTLLSLLRH